MTKAMKTVDRILAEKNYVVNKFDQAGFRKAIIDFFKSHDVKETILLVPKRFVEMEATDPSFVPDAEKEEYEKSVAKLETDKKRGWIDMTDLSIWEKKVEDPYDPITFAEYIMASNKGLIRPMIYVDEPFLTNAAVTLSWADGFVIKKQRGGKYLVSLI